MSLKQNDELREELLEQKDYKGLVEHGYMEPADAIGKMAEELEASVIKCNAIAKSIRNKLDQLTGILSEDPEVHLESYQEPELARN